MNADGSNVRQLTNNALRDEGPAWSPDGTRFAFSRGADDLHLDIWAMAAGRVRRSPAHDLPAAGTSHPTGP